MNLFLLTESYLLSRDPHSSEARNNKRLASLPAAQPAHELSDRLFWSGQLVLIRLGLALSLCAISISAYAQHREGPPSPDLEQDSRSGELSLRELLANDGTIDLTTGWEGSVSLAGFDVVVGADGRLMASPHDGTASPTWTAMSAGMRGAGLNGAVSALAMDGTGNLYVGGRFTKIGDRPIAYVARWDGSSWHALVGHNGEALDGPVNALAVHGATLFVGGEFQRAGSLEVGNVALWRGNTWTALTRGDGQAGVGGDVYALAVDAFGHLFIGGRFPRKIVRWAGTFTDLGTGIAEGGCFISCWTTSVRAIAISGSTVFVGGSFARAGGIEASNIARWNGSSWSSVGSGTDATVSALVVSGSSVYVGGGFTTAGGVSANRIARWTGSAWLPLGSGVTGSETFVGVSSLAVSGSTVYAGGRFETAGGQSAQNIARWNGSTWSAMGEGATEAWAHASGSVDAIAVGSGGVVHAGGQFSRAGSTASHHLARWDGNGWHSSGSDVNYPVLAMAVHERSVYIGGRFTTAGDVPARYIARWDGGAWHPLGQGLNGPVYALTVDLEGNVYAGGNFSEAGTVTALSVARWDGTAWGALGSGVRGTVEALSIGKEGDLYVGGWFREAGGNSVLNVARWDGWSWRSLGEGVNATVSAVAVAPTGDVYVGGSFTTAGDSAANRIARWDGSAWHPLGSGLNQPVAVIAVGDDGVLFAGGAFTTAGDAPANRIARWDGEAWSPVGNGLSGSVLALAFAPEGDLLAGGGFFGGISRWDGTRWLWSSESSARMDNAAAAFGVDQNGYIYVGGYFDSAGSILSRRIARWNGSKDAWPKLPPRFTTKPVTEATAYQEYRYEVEAVSPEGNSVWLYVHEHPHWLDIVSHGLGQGRVTLVGTPDAIDAGTESEVVVRAVAEELSTEQRFTIRVAAVNRAPVVEWTPPKAEALAYRVFRFQILATDPDGDDLTFGAEDLPDWLVLSNERGMGILEGTPTNENGGHHHLVIRVSDGELWTDHEIMLTVGYAPVPVLVTADRASILLAGEHETPLGFSWNASAMPGADSLFYTWQATLHEDAFDGPVTPREILAFSESSPSTGVAITYGQMHEMLVAADVELGRSIVLYHRVVATGIPAADSLGGEPLRMVDTHGAVASLTIERGTMTGTSEILTGQTFALGENYPNPFSARTTIVFSTPQSADVRIGVYDLLGRHVATVVDERLASGTHQRDLDGSALSTGVYLVRMSSGSFSHIRRIIVAR